MKKLLVAFAFVFILGMEAVAQQPQDESAIIENWFAGPDRTDYKWQVRVSEPYLDYQQRYVVSFFAELNPTIIRKKPGSAFRFILRIADAGGNWFPGQNDGKFTVPENGAGINSFTLRSWAYLVPGHYRYALLMYNSTDHTGSIKHGWILAPALDILPDITRDFPKVEFPLRVPGMNEGSPTRDLGLAQPRGIEYLPIANSKPLRIEVLLDFSEVDEVYLPEFVNNVFVPKNSRPEFRGAYSEMMYQENVRRILPVGIVLSHLKPAAGCVRVSAIDITRMHIIEDRKDATTVDWNRLEEAVIKADHAQIDSSTLIQQEQRTRFMRDFLKRIATDTHGCGPESNIEGPVILVIAPDIIKTKIPYSTFEGESCPKCEFYYLRMSEFASDSRDPYGKMLNSVQAHRIRFETPLEFRKVLDKLIREIQLWH